jgi:hypothetical protein
MVYIETEWENRPSKKTPVNATKLRKIENGIYTNSINIGELTDLNTETKENLVEAINETNTKNCLTIKRIENTLDVTEWQGYDVSFPIISSQKGNKLSVNENGQVVIGAGINYIKVNLNFEFVCSVTTTSYIQFKILKNSEVMAVNRIYNLTADIRENSYYTCFNPCNARRYNQNANNFCNSRNINFRWRKFHIYNSRSNKLRKIVWKKNI